MGRKSLLLITQQYEKLYLDMEDGKLMLSVSTWPGMHDLSREHAIALRDALTGWINAHEPAPRDS